MIRMCVVYEITACYSGGLVFVELNKEKEWRKRQGSMQGGRLYVDNDYDRLGEMEIDDKVISFNADGVARYTMIL